MARRFASIYFNRKSPKFSGAFSPTGASSGFALCFTLMISPIIV